MIKSFKHSGLERFFLTGSKAGIQPKHARRLEELLTAIDAASGPEMLRTPSLRLHPLKGELEGHWSVWVNGNWRVTFRFADGDAEIVDYQDYH